MEKEKEKEIISKIVAKAATDQVYNFNLIQNPNTTIKEEYKDLNLSNKEIETIVKKSKNRILGLSHKELYEIIKQTLSNAQRSFRIIVSMSVILFFVGIVLIIFAAISGLINQGETYSLIFGGIGTTDILVLFIFKPIKRVQKSIGDLVQLEISYLNYNYQFEYLTSFMNKMEDPDLDKIAKINTFLDKLVSNALKNIENYIEEK